MAVFENNLYVVTGQDFLSPEFFGIKLTEQNVLARFSTQPTQDLRGVEITPTDKSFIMGPSFEGPTKISAVDKTLLVLGVPAFRSIDDGQTWANLGIDINLLPSNNSSVFSSEREYFLQGGTIRYSSHNR